MAKKSAAPADADSQERRWSQIIQSLEEGVVGVDGRGRILSMNQAAEALTACSFAAVSNRGHRQVFGNSAWIAELVDAVLEGDRASVSAEGAIVGLWQRTTPVRATVSAIIDSVGRRGGAALILQDLTMQRNLETDVRRSQSLAQLGVLVAGLAHEIRNPLGGIRGAIQLLAGEIGPHPTAKEYTDLVLREVDRLSKLLEELLQLGPRGPFTPQPVNIHRVLDHVAALVAESASGQGVRLLRFYDPSLPEVRGDPDALTQMVLNIVQNALQAIASLPPGSASEIRLTTRLETDYHLSRSSKRLRGRGRLLRVDVEDTGPGIPAHLQPNLFTPFVTSKPKGTGLGLAICQRIVSDHGGTIRVESDPGRTLVRITLPTWEAGAPSSERSP